MPSRQQREQFQQARELLDRAADVYFRSFYDNGRTGSGRPTSELLGPNKQSAINAARHIQWPYQWWKGHSSAMERAVEIGYGRFALEHARMLAGRPTPHDELPLADVVAAEQARNAQREGVALTAIPRAPAAIAEQLVKLPGRSVKTAAAAVAAGGIVTLVSEFSVDPKHGDLAQLVQNQLDGLCLGRDAAALMEAAVKVGLERRIEDPMRVAPGFVEDLVRLTYDALPTLEGKDFRLARQALEGPNSPTPFD